MASAGALWRWLRQWRREHLLVDRVAVLRYVDEAGQLGPRYAFMTVMACGIATLGLLQNSVAVIIGAMLISPLMGPIVELGMSLAIFDLRSLREAMKTLAVGAAVALVTSVAIVLVSPLQEATPEILARTEPTLFDLLVAVLSGLAGAYATITRKGETIVGVAIATALMPPLAVVGFGIATLNASIAGGAVFLFMTNLLAIALSVTIMARWYRFGEADTPKQTAWQAAMIVGTFVVLSIPLGVALRDIAARGLAERTIRNVLDASAREEGGQITSLRVDRNGAMLRVDAVLLTSRHRSHLDQQVELKLEELLQRPVVVELREVLTADDQALANEQASLAQLRDSVLRLQSVAERDAKSRTAASQSMDAMRDRALAHFGRLDLLEGGQQARWQLNARSGLDVEAAWRLERDLAAGKDLVVQVQVVPALQALPVIVFGDDSAAVGEGAAPTVEAIAWALKRWGVERVRVDGYAGGDAKLALARAQALADALGRQGIAATASGVEGTAARATATAEGRQLLREARVRFDMP